MARRQRTYYGAGRTKKRSDFIDNWASAMASDRAESHVGRLFRYYFYNVVLRLGIVLAIVVVCAIPILMKKLGFIP